MPSAGRGTSVHILVADDHPLFVGALEAVVESDPRYEIVGVAKDGEEAVKLAEELSPDIVLLDEELAHRESSEVTRRLRETKSAPRVLMLTGAPAEHSEVEARGTGANAFVRRPRSATDLLETLKVVTLLVDPLAAAVAEVAAYASAARVSVAGVDRRP
jgi:two-component system response regulator DesR